MTATTSSGGTDGLGLGKDLTGLQQLSCEQIEGILDTAEPFKEISERRIKKVPVLRGKTIVNLFLEPSTRTRISFEFAEKRLSADTVNIASSGSSVEKGESLVDTARNLEAMRIDMVVIRHGSSGAARFLADEVAVCGPKTLIPLGIEELGVTVLSRVEEAIEWAEVVYVLRLQLERMDAGFVPSLREYNRFFGISRARLERAPGEITVLHPGPMNRGVEIDSDVADGPWSLILPQVTNGVAVRMAVLYLLAGGSPERAESAKEAGE
ncbi:MAG: aspartate carbamoyltransferase [Gemmatimonadales bacterium]